MRSELVFIQGRVAFVLMGADWVISVGTVIVIGWDVDGGMVVKVGRISSLFSLGFDVSKKHKHCMVMTCT